MNDIERKALRVIEGQLELLRNAIIIERPQRELEFRMRDIIADVRAVAAGNSATVADFPAPNHN